MNQEKKVIRVLKPTKKAKKVSPIYYGILGTAFGVIVTSVLLFTFLKDDSITNSNQSISNIENVSEQSPPQTSNTSPILSQDDPSNSESDHENGHDGYNQPQPNVNEITNVFKHKPETPVTAVAPKPSSSSGNPFDNFGQPKPKPAPVVTHTTKQPTVAQKSLQAKVSEPPKTIKKPEPAVSKPENKIEQTTAKTKAVEKEDYEVPHATVQIAVTRKAKE